MFDIFTKTRIDAAPDPRASAFHEVPGLKDAWLIANAIDDALKVAESDRRIFARRVNDVVSRAAVTLGNGNDEYLERELLDTLHLDLFDAEIRDRNAYLVRLERNIAHLKRLKSGLLSGFPELDQGAVRPG